jgi:RNA polymerase sigma-70 factor (ECF subfamily)
LVTAGDPAAVRKCITQYGPLVWSIARRFAPDASEEAAREIFVELWKHAGRFDPLTMSEPAFVTMIARRCMLDRLRSAKRRPQLKPAPDSLASSEQHTASERCVEAAIASGVLATLDPRQRRILSLAIGQGMTHAEIAKATATPLGMVKSLVRRALIAVRKRVLTQEGATR